MSTPLNPQEIYLLERYCKPDPFEKVRGAWADLVKHAETMLDRFMRQLPPDYRNRPLWNQPDRVWGELVLPNFRDTLQMLNTSHIKLTHGDLRALDGAGGVASALRAVLRKNGSTAQTSECLYIPLLSNRTPIHA